MTVAAEQLARKKRLGDAASYRIIGERIGRDKMVVYRLLNEQEQPFPLNEEAIMADIGRALDELESEQTTEAA